MNTLLGNGRNENYRRILQENKLLTQSFGVTQSRGIVLLVQIPLVDNQNNSLACLMSIAYNTFILLGNTLDSVKTISTTSLRSTARRERITLYFQSVRQP